MKETAIILGAVLLTTAAAQAKDLKFTLKDATDSILTRFYTSPVGVMDWEGDVFGEQVLIPAKRSR